MKNLNEKLKYTAQLVLLLGILGYIGIDSGILGLTFLNFDKPKQKEKVSNDDRPEFLKKYADEIQVNLETIETDLDSRAVEVKNVRKLLSHYNEQIRENRRSLEEVRREISHLINLKKKVSQKIRADLYLNAETNRAVPEILYEVAASLRANLTQELPGEAMALRRWDRKIYLGLPVFSKVEELNEEFNDFAKSRISRMVEVALNRGVISMRIASSSIDPKDQAKANFLLEYIKQTFGDLVAIQTIDPREFRGISYTGFEIWFEPNSRGLSRYGVNEVR